MNNNGSSDSEFRAAVQEHFTGLLGTVKVENMEKATDEVIASVGVDKLKEMIAAKKAKKVGKKATKTKRNINKKGKKGKKTKKTKKRKGKTMKKRKY